MIEISDWKTGAVHDGFRLDRMEALPNLRATAYLFEHVRSGARILNLHAPQESESCFCVTFPTPPPDDTGLPHILEHSVLGGSRKYPVKEPFFEMVKISMATFINAMTAPTYTIYPVCSTVKKDFFNLVEVYLDAVFHPELAETTFRREAHHYTLTDNRDLASALQIKGIVYSEMKGYYSEPDGLMWIHMRELTPDTPVGRNSAGDPECIPTLTYDAFRRYHADHYQPSNALFFSYGDIPVVEHLRFLAPTLDDYTGRPVSLSLPFQPRWSAPRRRDIPYPVGPTTDLARATYIALNWLVDDATDPAAATDWSILGQILFGNEAALLKKAIIDSQLGADLYLSGAGGQAYEQAFHVGLKGSERDRADAFERLVLDTLGAIADGAPITRDRVEAAFQQMAYQNLEISSLFPLRVGNLVAATWPFGRDPLAFLRMDQHLAECRRRYEADPALFNRLIRARLLDNPHRLRIVLYPDREAQARQDAAFTAHMADIKARLSPDDVARIAREALRLEEEQAQLNPPEAVARLPQLKVSDLPARPRHVTTARGAVADIAVLRNDVFTNGVNYLEIDIDLAGLPPELYPVLPHFTEAINKLGAAGNSFAEIAARRAASTGGLWCGTFVARHAVDPTRSLRRLRVGLKTLNDQAPEALRLLGDLLFNVDPGDRERLHDVLNQSRAWYRTTLVDDGFGTARRRAGRGLSPEAALDYRLVSPEMLADVEALCRRFDTRADTLAADLLRIRTLLANPRRWTVSFTGADTAFAHLDHTLGAWRSRMTDAPVVDAPPPFTPSAGPAGEGLAAPMQIAYCARVMPAPHLNHPDISFLRLSLYLARFDYCLPEIRFRGNAYGAGVAHDDCLGATLLYSYFDPRIVETLQVFDRFADYVRATAWTQTDLNRAIIGSSKEVEKPIRPWEATGAVLSRHIRGDTDDLYDRRYADLLRATPQRIRQVLLDYWEANAPRAVTCVVSSREKLEEANRRLGDQPLIVSDLLDEQSDGNLQQA